MNLFNTQSSFKKRASLFTTAWPSIFNHLLISSLTGVLAFWKGKHHAGGKRLLYRWGFHLKRALVYCPVPPDKAGSLEGRTSLDNDTPSSPTNVLSPPPTDFKYLALAQNAFVVVSDFYRHLVPVVQVFLSIPRLFRDHTLKSNLHQYEGGKKA